MTEPPPTGLLADRYRLLEQLGEGGASVVFRVRDERLDADRALKLLHPSLAEGGMRRRLEDEARAMAQLDHPHVLRVYDVGEDAGRAFVVMALARNSLADELIADGPQPAEIAVSWILQALSALAAAHALGIVHRDVKPQNLLVESAGTVVLADFGIALLTDGRHERSTRTGAAMGSLAYMAPEQRLDARNVGPQADVYAVGASLYHLLTGASPMDLFVADERSPRWGGVPPALQAVLARATRYEPSRRHADARDLAADLVGAMHQMGLAHAIPATLDDPLTWPAPAPGLLTVTGPLPNTSVVAPTVEALAPTAPYAPTTGVAERSVAAAAPRRELRWVMLAVALGLGAFSAWWIWLAPPSPAPFRRSPQLTATPPPAPLPSDAAEAGPPDPAAPSPGEPGDAVADASGAAASGAAASVAPEAAPEAAPSTQPAPRRTPASVAASGSPPEAAPSAKGPPPFGRWEYNSGGVPAEMVLSGSPEAVIARFRLLDGANAVPTVADGRFDPASGLLLLEDRDPSAWDAGRYQLRLDRSARTLTGSFERRDGGQKIAIAADNWTSL